MEFDGKTYRLYAIFNQKSHATTLAKVNRVNGFSVRITEQDVRGKSYLVWGRQKKPGYAIDWLTLKNLSNIIIPKKNFRTVMYGSEYKDGRVEMD
jgi:hypothetical protein